MDTGIIKILAENLLNIEKEKIKEIYKVIYSGEIDELEIEQLYDFYKRWKDIGENFQIDLPFWYTEKEKNKPTIMIIGIDANNKLKKAHENVVISAPYHSQDKNEDNIYNKILKELKPNFSIYLTDLYKLFYWHKKNGENKRSHEENVDFTGNEIHTQILLKEIKLVKPNLIVAFGDDVRSACAKIFNLSLNNTISTDDVINNTYNCKIDNNNLKFIAVPHPSPLAQKHWIEFIKVNNLDNNLSEKKDRRIYGTVKIIQEILAK